MPILVKVDHQLREVHSTAVGPVTYADLREHLLLERRLDGLAYPEIFDTRGAGVSLTPAEIRHLVAMLRTLGGESKLGPTAVIVSSDTVYGLMRMIEILVEDVCDVRPFRDEQEARAWLAAQPRE